MAYNQALHIPNGLILDFTIDAANTGSDSFLGVDTDGSLTKFSSIPASRVGSGGNLTEATSSVLTITGGSGALLSNATIQVKLAGSGQSGYLSSTDWNTFNNKLSTSLTSAYVFVGNGSNVATGVSITGDISISNAGVVAIATGVIVNADINNSAAIAVSKLAAMSTNLVVATDGSGFVTTVAGFTTTIAGYLTTLTSNVQTQLNTKIASRSTNSIVQSPTAVQNGYAIVWDSGASEYTLAASGSGGSVTGPSTSTYEALVRWNSSGGTSVMNSTVLLDGSGNLTAVNSITINTSGLHLLDTDASHDLIITVGSNLTADRTLTITTGDAGRTLTISGDATINDWFDQSVKAAASPSFADVTLSNAGGLHILDSDSSHDLIITTSSNLTADRTLTLVPGDVSRTLTINASGTIYVTGGTDVALADGGTGASLSDPGANALWGWDDTDNAIKFISIGTGLSYDHASYTLSNATGLLTAEVDLSSSDILALFTSPKQLIAAPGAGKIIDIVSIDVQYDYNSVAYLTATSFFVGYTTTGGANLHNTGINFNGSVDLYTKVSLDNQNAWNAATRVNTAICAYCPAANPTAGNGTITVFILYRVLTL